MPRLASIAATQLYAPVSFYWACRVCVPCIASGGSMTVECRHCNGTGTCSNGENANSCDSCAEKARESPFPFIKKTIVSTKGLPCGSCQGYGDVEGRVWHLQSMIVPVLALFVVSLVLIIVLVIAVTSPTHHPEIITLLGTLAGSVVGFYFRGHHTLPRAPQTRIPKLGPPNSPPP